MRLKPQPKGVLLTLMHILPLWFEGLWRKVLLDFDSGAQKELELFRQGRATIGVFP